MVPLELLWKEGLAGVGSTVGSLVVLDGTASCGAGLALVEAVNWSCWLPCWQGVALLAWIGTP